MTNESAVHFATNRRIHIGLAVRNLEQSMDFYRALFGTPPTKIRPHYAKFEVAEPPVNLSLSEVAGKSGQGHPVDHFGIEVKSTEQVDAAAARLTKAGVKTEVEEQVICCYAVQDKVWATDPDGIRWETYVVLDQDGPHHHSSLSNCCSDSSANETPVSQNDSARESAADCNCDGAACCCSGQLPAKD